MRGRAFFVTGTDTGVGKTWVSCQLLRAWTLRGCRSAGLKAAESGGLTGGDDEALFTAAGAWQPERCRYRFEPAVAPGVAADDAGAFIDFEVIVRQVERLRAEADRVVVEGAGGWLVPMGLSRTIETLARELGLEVLVVARAGLGTINHSALTVRAVESQGLSVAGILMSVLPSDDRAFAERNLGEISQICGAPGAVVGNEVDAASAVSSLDL